MRNFQSFNSFISLFILVFYMVSCSSDDASEEGGGTSGTPNSIVLHSNISSGETEINETINFTVKGSDNKDYTGKSTIYLDGNAISGQSHEFSEAGTYEFTAKMGNLTSNKISITVKNAASQPNAITLSSDLESSKTDINNTVSFRVMGDNGEEYTSQSTIKVNGESITGNQYAFGQGGEHAVTASYNDLNSNSLAIEVVSSNYITVNRNKALREQEINFEFFGPDGENATTSATFFVNGNAISSNTFSSPSPGVFEVTAKTTDGEETEAKTFEIFMPKRKALFEDYTGTWCGWCPRVTNAILQLKERTEDIVVIGIHIQDEMMLEQARDLATHFEVEFFPHARLNRTSVVEFPEDEEEQLQQVLTVAGSTSPYSIAINTSLNNNLLDVEVKLISEIEIPQNHKLVAYVLQNGIIFPQINYLNNDPSSRWYQLGDPIKNFVHDDVLEFSLTGIFGDNLNTIPALEEAVFEFGPVNLSEYSYSGPGNSYNPNNFEVVVILVEEDYTALNAQKVTVGQNVNFE